MNQTPLVLNGKWYPKGNSTALAACIRLDSDSGQVQVQEQDTGILLARSWVTKLEASARLGNTPRYVQVPDAGQFETRESDTLDLWLARWQPSRWRGWVHKLESRWRFVAVTVMILLATGWGTVQYGLPTAARHIAHSLPADTLDQIAKESLALLDRFQFQPSELDPARQHELQDAFAPMLERFPELPLRVLFRKGGERVGANAMALPDGTIIFTDEMIELAESDQELLSVLGHEIGHVAHRHSLRSFIQNATLGAIYVLLVGDVSGSAELLTGVPVVMATLSYSRDHEWEADRFAAQLMDEMDLDRAAFTNLMQRVYRGHHQDRWARYLSTHPDMAQRLEAFHRH